MKRHPAYPPVPCRYGAPMGRRDQDPSPTPDQLHLVRVPLDSGGYDPGGAYWGIGQPLFCAWTNEGFRRYFRAPSRKAALAIAKEHRELDPNLWSVTLPSHNNAVLSFRGRTAWTKRTAKKHAQETGGLLEPAWLAQEIPA